ncbi:MAG: APC family permease [Syntrophomonadaceae bacterium]|nr:APC family permease [Syntrophomonadaceae bacterium]
MIRQFIRWIFGQKMASSRLSAEKLSIFWGMPILSSDAISSVAYAVEELLLVLVPVIGVASFIWMPRLAVVIIILLIVLTFSYRHVVDAYPHGGGAYIVAKENLSPLAGLVAGASLSVDYTLTVAVSICAGTAAITSAVPLLYPHRVGIAVLLIILLIIANVRGIRESARILSLPTYAFIFSIIALVVVGVIKHAAGGAVDVPPPPMGEPITLGTQAVTVFLLLRAFSSGCSAVTGIEAVSDAVPNFKDPAPRNAKIVYILLTLSIIICFGGVAYLVNLYHAFPNDRQTILAQITLDVFGHGGMFYFIQAITAIILAMAANTAFAGFPTLLSVIAQDGYAPRQLKLRGHRLNYTNGITSLGIMAIILVIIFQADTHLLIGLYAVGVFTSFTLSQSGMLVHWFRQRSPGWQYRALVNGLGALTTFTAVVIIGVTKFTEGAWIVVVVVPLIIMVMLKIKAHYQSVARQLDIPNDTLSQIQLIPAYSHHVIVPIDSLNAMVVKALRYARTMTDSVEAFHIETYEGEADKLRKKWAMLNSGIPLIIKQSPYREVVGPLKEYIDSEEHASQPGDIITVLLPQFFVPKWWHTILHNNTSLFIANAMFSKRNVVVSILPFYLEDLNRYKVKITTPVEAQPRND